MLFQNLGSCGVCGFCCRILRDIGGYVKPKYCGISVDKIIKFCRMLVDIVVNKMHFLYIHTCGTWCCWS